jgi:hypothetical protein
VADRFLRRLEASSGRFIVGRRPLLSCAKV